MNTHWNQCGPWFPRPPAGQILSQKPSQTVVQSWVSQLPFWLLLCIQIHKHSIAVSLSMIG